MPVNLGKAVSLDNRTTRFGDVGRLDVHARKFNRIYGFDFDGTNDYLLLSGQPAGIADAKTGLIVATVRVDTTDTDMAFVRVANGRFGFNRANDNAFQIFGFNAAGVIKLRLKSALGTREASASFLTVYGSWDLANGVGSMWVGDTQENSAALDILVDDAIDYTSDDWGIGADGAGATKLNGAILQLWFRMGGTYFDLTQAANRRRITDADGNPLRLNRGADYPLYTAPDIYVGDGTIPTMTTNGAPARISYEAS